MKFFKYFLILLVVISACKKDEQEELEVNLPKNYDSGMYILTDQGISFYNYLSVDTLRTLTEDIFKKVNNIDIIQPRSLHISGKHAYIIGDKLYIANIETFGNEGIVDDFSDPISCKQVDADRLYVVDKGDATVKIVNLNNQEVLGHIETGDTSTPINIVGSWYRAFVMNGGGGDFINRDSSIVSIDYFQSGVVINDFSGKLDVGYNPSSAAFSTNNLWVLCKGVYNTQDLSNNTQSSIYKIAPWSNVIDDHKSLTDIYNADNLAINESKSRMFFSSTDGIYMTDLTIFPILHIHY